MDDCRQSLEGNSDRETYGWLKTDGSCRRVLRLIGFSGISQYQNTSLLSFRPCILYVQRLAIFRFDSISLVALYIIMIS